MNPVVTVRRIVTLVCLLGLFSVATAHARAPQLSTPDRVRYKAALEHVESRQFARARALAARGSQALLGKVA